LQVDLYIDGKKFIANNENPEILDDWPLHRTKQVKTRLVVGACWHGRSQSISQFFKGHLSSMLYLAGKVEQHQALLCAHQCKEQLQFTAIDQLVPGELSLTPAKGYVFVQKEADPVLSISGVSVVNSDQHLVKTGAPMLPDIKITVTQTINDGEVFVEDIDKTSESMLDWCKVHLKPSRDMDLEYFSSPASLIAALHIDFEHDKQVITL
uniref:Uncharacterized protein n=1 Tax=Parascaris equorum TaxID=6256 RepID=A0A914RIK8_PAREQ